MFRARMFRLWTSEMFRSCGRRSVLRRSDSNLKKLTANYAGGNRRQIILWLVDSLSLRGNEWTCINLCRINLCAFINFSPPFAKTIHWIFISHWRGWQCVSWWCSFCTDRVPDRRKQCIKVRRGLQHSNWTNRSSSESFFRGGFLKKNLFIYATRIADGYLKMRKFQI